jgi:hypothetical protein
MTTTHTRMAGVGLVVHVCCYLSKLCLAAAAAAAVLQYYSLTVHAVITAVQVYSRLTLALTV